ncbi:MAG: YqeG family HAD IIIA-type phosphatase, partial [Leptolyngbyaceae bacterium]|nr:YqeG family HAD IIIA-type phosphatase [Leptolyngbyaceae bacterium]
VLGQTVLALTPERIQTYGIKGMVLDVDETIVPFRQAKTSADLNQWFAEIKSVVSLWLVSNNTSERRIEAIAASLDVPYVAKAAKPSRRKLRQVLTQMDLPPHEVAMVGDRLFTDIVAGNRLGMFTIWVEPIEAMAQRSPKELLRNSEIWLAQQLGAVLHSPQ